MADNVRETWRFLRGRVGLTPAQAAGVIGSMQGESGKNLDPTARNPSSGAYGIAQWLGGRKTSAVTSGDLRQQLNHLWHELQGPERGAFKAIRAAHTPEQAAIAWQREFERGAPHEQKYNLRAANARDVFNRLRGEPGSTGGGGASGGAGSRGTTRTTTEVTAPGVDNSMGRYQAVQDFLGSKSSDPLQFAMQIRGLQDVAPTVTKKTVTSAGGGQGGADPVQRGAAAGSGAASALNWVHEKLDDPGSVETGGANQGQLASYLNKRFGMSGAPWCAMFTSAAVTKGGAPPSARTASVAQVRAKAQSGQGYQRGFISARNARPGDLVLFGNSHIAMVTGVKNGQIQYVGGNQSNRVSKGSTGGGGNVSIVRPKYGARR